MSELGQINSTSHESTATEYGVGYELFEGNAYAVEDMQARSRAWVETGSCPGPEVIGRITIDDESLQHLFNNLPRDYQIQDGPGELISKDDAVAERYAHREAISMLDPRTREILRDLFSQFNELIQQDTDRSDNPVAEESPLSYISSFIKFGRYTQTKEELHIDENYSESKGVDASDIRYVATIVGPNTVTYTGDGLGPELFDFSGDFSGDALPSTITRSATNTGEVNRFVRRGDPHALPVAEDEPRVFMSGTVRVKARQDV